jgi:RHS repeat-associated protein
MISERITANGSLVTNSYVYGLDLSGSAQGAGTIGGIVSMLLATNSLQPSAYYPSYDANGNVTDLTDTNGTSVAHYEYDPYGNTTPASFSTVANPFQFSTKYFDAETGMYYYGFRYYSPQLGRWISRDMLGDLAFLTAYSLKTKTYAKFIRLEDESRKPPFLFIENNPINVVDQDGNIAWIWPVAVIFVYESSVHLMAFNYGLSTYPGADPHSKCIRHCCTSCIITRFNVGIPLTAVSGTLYEILEYFVHGYTNPTGMSDVQNNLKGIGAAYNVFNGCNANCKKKCACVPTHN